METTACSKFLGFFVIYPHALLFTGQGDEFFPCTVIRFIDDITGLIQGEVRQLKVNTGEREVLT